MMIDPLLQKNGAAMSHEHHSIRSMLGMITEPNQTACLRLLEDNLGLFRMTPGSSYNHQAWPNGYLDHVSEAMNIGVILYQTLNALRPLPFSLSDLLLILFLHDVEKPWKYEIDESGNRRYRGDMRTKVEHQQFRVEKFRSYGIVLDVEQMNGLEFAEGEVHDHSNQHRAMGPLAAVAHMCDVASARLWFERPSENDPWNGASRASE